MLLAPTSSLPPRRTSAAPGRLASTLLELVLVIAIIAIAIGIAVPSLGGFVKNRDLADSAADFVATARYARTKSISDATIYRLNLDTNQGHWWLTKADDTGANFIPADPTGETDRTLSPKLQFTCSLAAKDGSLYLEFQATGQTDPATVTFSGPDNGSIQVSCDSPFDVFHINKPGGSK